MGMLSIAKTLPKIIRHGGSKMIFAVKKAKPEILVFTGGAVVVGSFIWAMIAARKMDSVMEEGNSKIADIQDKIEETVEAGNQLSDAEKKTALSQLSTELRKDKADKIWQMFMLLGVPVIFFAGGMCMMVGGHLLLVRRFGEVSTALAVLQETFNRYRAMNIAEHGEECDRRYRYGITGETEIDTLVTDVEGNEKQMKCTVPVVERDAASMYTFIFSEEFSRKCPKDPVCTISFLRSQEKYWNMWMESTGKPVTLGMIIDELGIELDPDDPANDYILIAGWRPNGDGDNRIDFGIMRAVNKRTLNMQENVVMLNFNCDGNIYHSTRYTKDGKKVC